MTSRDEFRRSDTDILAKRVGNRCSNPACRQSTAGPRDDPTKAANIGVASHITAAAPGGPRYDVSSSVAERKSIQNGIWLCQKCGKLVDTDPSHYSVTALRSWKSQAEENARLELEGTVPSEQSSSTVDVVLHRRNDNIGSERHDYRLEVFVHNVGTNVFRNYHVDLELPTHVLVNPAGRVEDRSDQSNSLFRMVWRGDADNVFPGDRKLVFNIPYFMDNKMFQDRSDLFSQPVRCTLYEGGHRLVFVEQDFREFQIF